MTSIYPICRPPKAKMDLNCSISKVNQRSLTPINLHYCLSARVLRRGEVGAAKYVRPDLNKDTIVYT